MLISASKGIVVAQIRQFMAVFEWLRYLASPFKEQEKSTGLTRISLSKAFLAIPAVLLLFSTRHVSAGGSGLNTLIVVNQNSSNSCAVGNYYCERRQVPPENLLRITWSGSNISWTNSDFQTNLLNPLLAAISSRQLSNQIDYVVLSMDIPYRTINNGLANGTTTALFYGVKADSGPSWPGITNSYFASEQIFSRAKPASAPGYSFLATMITADSVTQAKKLIDQGVLSDGTFPAFPVMLAKSSDQLRNIRFKAFDNAAFNARVLGNCMVQRTNTDSLWGQTNLLGWQTGLPYFGVPTNSFVPGAIADSMTSFGGLIFGQTDQTTLMAFINAGASGSYGTVTEPSPITAKFPDPQDYFYQSRGFSLAEAYYLSLFEPYEGLIVAEPLAAPFQRTAAGKWSGISSNAVLTGTAQLSAQFTASDQTHPLQQVDLFVDGKYFSTVTNADPQLGNVLTASLNGYSVSYTVASNPSLKGIASGLAAALNNPAVTNITQTTALASGDRIELHGPVTSSPGSAVFFTDSFATNQARAYKIVSLPTAPVLSTATRDSSGAFHCHLDTGLATSVIIQASTNLTDWIPVFTNLTGGPVDFVDPSAAFFPKRYYRAIGIAPDTRPRLTALGRGPSGGPKLHLEPLNGGVCTLEASTNLLDWTSVFINSTGLPVDFEDVAGKNFARRFYRVSTPATSPNISLVSQSSSSFLLRVDGETQPFTIQASTDFLHWFPVFTNSSVGKISAVATANKGAAPGLTTFLHASRDTLLDSQAFGYQSCSINGTLNLGNWLRLDVTKTNGSVVSLSLTNLSLVATIMDLSSNLCSLINSSTALQNADGLVAEDLAPWVFGAATFNLRARSPGPDAAKLRVSLTASAGLGLSPGSDSALTQNISDLQPRNHLYVLAGATNLVVNFPLNTLSLPDGYHDLTLVAYEGSSVRTQTRISLPVIIHNSSLSATLTPLDFGSNAPASGTYHLQIAANTTNVNAIRLYATGGLLNTTNNQSTATFTITGPALGTGLHPLYALIDTPAGTYRTQTRWLRLTDP